MITVVPIGQPELRVDELRRLRDELARIFNTGVDLIEPIPLSFQAYDPIRDQYRASLLIDSLPEDEIVLGITGVDLFAPHLNFVFGEANPVLKRAIISTFRLDRKNPLFLERVIKEAVHEIGHLLGLGHCPDPRCIMHFSNTIQDTDLKGPGFCKNCLLYLKE
ncbi:archemetzincin [candidate division WOR-3 bacterium]|uniref:Archemetzincin n=1 Tax=candidate division WOR-3 bacterium TaxID=2052148 RepID=A0A660SGM2_UNCW3|nr:MAG: archemetzincin [candidate division WOR-3 bacterium]